MIHTCRICFEEDIRVKLISPCLCSGSSKYVHSNCLEDWRNVNLQNEKYYMCEICKERYILELVNKNINDLYFQYKLFIGLELLVILTIVITSITILGSLLKIVLHENTNFINNRYINDFVVGLLFILLVSFIIAYTYLIFTMRLNPPENNLLNFNGKVILVFVITIGFIIILFFILKYILNIRKKYFFDKYYINQHRYKAKDREII